MVDVTYLVGLIPARAGSKRLPDKNVRPFAGSSLLELTIGAALAAGGLDEVALSTDSDAYLDIARGAGLSETYKRPAALAADDTTSIDAVVDYLDWRSANGRAAATHLVLLQPTSPFRTAAMIDAAIRQWRRSGKASLVSAAPAAPSAGYLLRRVATPGATRLETEPEGPDVYILDGTIYITPLDMVMTQRRFWNADSEMFVIDYPRAFDIDTAADFQAAEALLNEGIAYAHATPEETA